MQASPPAFFDAGEDACAYPEIQQDLGQRGRSVTIEPANPLAVLFQDWPDRTSEQAQNWLRLTRFPARFPHGVRIRVTAPLRIAGTRLFRAKGTTGVILLFA